MTKTYAQLARELKTLQTAAESAFASEKKEAVGKVNALIASYGLSASELAFAGKKAMAPSLPTPPVAPSKAASGARYQDGNGNVWGGRGPRPAWLRAALSAGQSLDSFAAGGAKLVATAKPKAAARVASIAQASSSAPKYQHPKTGASWGGRGPRPAWLKQALKKRGATLEDFASSAAPSPTAPVASTASPAATMPVAPAKSKPTRLKTSPAAAPSAAAKPVAMPAPKAKAKPGRPAAAKKAAPQKAAASKTPAAKKNARSTVAAPSVKAAPASAKKASDAATRSAPKVKPPVKAAAKKVAKTDAKAAVTPVKTAPAKTAPLKAPKAKAPSLANKIATAASKSRSASAKSAAAKASKPATRSSKAATSPESNSTSASLNTVDKAVRSSPVDASTVDAVAS